MADLERAELVERIVTALQKLRSARAVNPYMVCRDDTLEEAIKTVREVKLTLSNASRPPREGDDQLLAPERR